MRVALAPWVVRALDDYLAAARPDVSSSAATGKAVMATSWPASGSPGSAAKQVFPPA